MKSVTLRIALKSLLFYSRSTVNQFIIIVLLAAVITGSLLTGYSVRNSLKKKAEEKLGSTDLLISSGLRFFNASLGDKLGGRIGIEVVPLLETEGYVQHFSTGNAALNASIIGITDDFFPFHGHDSLVVEKGTAGVNTRLAENLGIKPGDEIIIHFRDMDALPSNAPFAPSKNENGSIVMRVSQIIPSWQSGNFSLGISQVSPLNVFINLRDLEPDITKDLKANRLLLQNRNSYSVDSIFKYLSESLSISDVGLHLRNSEKTGQIELISDRIFIDSAIVSGILEKMPGAWPLITYLANTIEVHGASAPYSFVAAIPPESQLPVTENEAFINKWLADDTGAEPGDRLRLTWFDPASGRLLTEKNGDFIITGIIDQDDNLSDPSLMPDFPGISGSTTCAGWDAGIPVLLDKIRDKDEEYWNKFRGTPKVFISYDTGRKIWGNSFGTATSVRFPVKAEPEEISKQLNGNLDPSVHGFTVSDIRNKSRKSASGGVDFSTLFLALGIFIILSCLILLSFAVSIHFDSRKAQIRTFSALGFKNRFIRNLLLSETLVLAIIAALAGIFLGYLINKLIIAALNSVWQGAVQTNTLNATLGIIPMVTGFLVTVVIMTLLLALKVRTFMKNLDKSSNDRIALNPARNNFILALTSFILGSILLVSSFLARNLATILSFIAGTVFFISFILSLRQYYVRDTSAIRVKRNVKNFYSRKFYSFYPSHAIAPVIFIAAGIFAVIITGTNRLVLDDKMLLPPGGTGGYLLWMESAVPVKEDLDLISGKREFGLDEPELSDLQFMQASKVRGDDASCLNLNHVTSPHLLGVEPDKFISKGAFSFASVLKGGRAGNPWSLLNSSQEKNTIYGIADQTVLQWGLKIKTGDTLMYSSEIGQPLKIVICGGLKASVFQGHLLISDKNLRKYFPSVEGSSVFLIDGNPEKTDYYTDILQERFSGHGISIETAGQKLASFFEVTNTYLDVFTILGAFGLVLGVAGMGFILIRNYNLRKQEYALMVATGYSVRRIRTILLKDQVIILLSGIITGTVSGIISTLPSLISGSEIPWNIIILMVTSVTVVGTGALMIAVRLVRGKSLVIQLRKE